MVMDNLPVHPAWGGREAIEAVRAKLVFLQPASPVLSPSE
jgi:transposase